jgi:hypothetical protein
MAERLLIDREAFPDAGLGRRAVPEAIIDESPFAAPGRPTLIGLILGSFVAGALTSLLGVTAAGG